MENKISMEEFTEYVRDNILSLLPDITQGAQVRFANVTKVNDKTLQGISIFGQPDTASPTIYLEHHYQNYISGRSLDEVLEDIAMSYRENTLKKDFNVRFMNDYEAVKDRLISKVVRYDTNKAYLKDKPYIRSGDLAMVFVVDLSNYDVLPEAATVTVTDSLMETWGKSPEELLHTARENDLQKGYSMVPMDEVIGRIRDGKPTPDHRDFLPERETESIMYVFENHSRLYGANIICQKELLEQAGQFLGKDYYIIPSSIHELIIIPDDGETEIEHLNKMVREVNENEVSETEILSDHVYHYDKDSRELSFMRDGEKICIDFSAREEKAAEKGIKHHLKEGQEKAAEKKSQPKESKTKAAKIKAKEL